MRIWWMRGEDQQSGGLFSYVDLEARVPADHPLRPISDDRRRGFERAVGRVRGAVLASGRPIPPERLLRALLLQAFYSVRSERLLIEQLDYNLLFRWFVGLGIDDPVWHPTAFTTNRDRLLEGDVAAKFLAAVLTHARVRQLRSREHFSVRRHADRGVGVDEELPPQGRHRRAAGRRPQRQPGLPRRAAAQRHPCLDHRWRRARLFRKGAGKEAKLKLHGPSADGEPLGSGGRGAPDPGHWLGRTTRPPAG